MAEVYPMLTAPISVKDLRAHARVSPPRPDRGISLRSTLLFLTAAATGMAALLAFLPAAGHDQLWCLYVARHALDGQQLYGPQLFESNPPLILWLSMIPESLATVAHLSATVVGKGLVLLLEAVVAFITLRQLRPLWPSLDTAQIMALAFAFVTLFNVVPARDLGQRDYLLALLCLPYLLAAAGWKPDAGWRLTQILIGLVAGVGLALKPHEAVVPVAIESFLLLRHRTLRTLLRPEPLVLVASAAAYLFAINKFTPAYISTILPLLRDTYWAVGGLSVPQLLWEAIELHLLAAITLFLYFRPGARPTPNPEGSTLIPVFITAGCASTLAYYLQGTGWYYQQLPAIIFFGFALTLQLLPLASRAVPNSTPKASAALGILALVLTAHFMDYPFTEARSFPIEAPDPTFFAGLAPGTAVATLTTTLDYTMMPAARYHLTIAQRYPHLWMLPAILRNEDPGMGHPPRHITAPARLAELDELQHQFMVEDLAYWKPQLVLVQRCQKAAVHCQLLEDRDDDLLAWFLRDPAFAAEWAYYDYAGHRGEFDAYTRKLSAR